VLFRQLRFREFSSETKMSSMVVQRPNGERVCFVQGADSEIVKLLASPAQAASILSQVNSWAVRGLRTICCANRVLEPDEPLGPEIEQNLIMLGAVAIEGELQDGVRETLAFFREAGVRFWMLTGDKRETAVSIGRSCGIVTPVQSIVDFHPGMQIAEDDCIVLIRPEIVDLLTRADLQQVADHASSAICYRMSPKMKSVVVTLARKVFPTVCYTGDGANDVAALQSASVGVGIIGREGRQAANNSDFAVPRFSGLRRLLACHGRLSIVRLAQVIRYMFYKNLLFCLPHIPWFFFTGWSPMPLYDSILMATFNLIWTILPPVELGFFEQDLSFRSMETRPEVYAECRTLTAIAPGRFIVDVLTALWQAGVLYYLNVVVCADDRETSGMVLFWAVVVVSNIEIFWRAKAWSIFPVLASLLSIVTLAAFLCAFGAAPDLLPAQFGSTRRFYTSSDHWTAFFASVAAAVAPEPVIDFLLGQWRPSKTRLIRESEAREGR
jgi:magnesium-transporting ATPase (P-type)